MNNKVATIIDIKMTDTTRHAQATQISWSQVAFIETTESLVPVNPRHAHGSNIERCNVTRKISSEQKGLNGIHHRELESARYYKDVLNSVMSHVHDDFLICHDAKLIKQLLEKAGVPTDGFTFICMQSVIKKLHPEIGDYTIPTLIYEFCENTAISYMPHNHKGCLDATFMRHIFRQVSILNNLKTMQDWSKF